MLMPAFASHGQRIIDARLKLLCAAAALALYLPDEQLDALTNQLLTKLRSPSLSSDHAQTYVHTIGALR